MRLTKAMLAGAILSALSAGTAFAGTWEKGQEPNQDKWWYSNGDGTYAQNGWQWIDGDNDGTAEYYYFDGAGWMLSDTVTPDGNQVNADGAWVINGVVQTQQVHAVLDTAASGSDISGTYSYYGEKNIDTGNINTFKDIADSDSVTVTAVDADTIHVQFSEAYTVPTGIIVMKKQGDVYVFDSYLGQDWSQDYAKDYTAELHFNGSSVVIGKYNAWAGRIVFYDIYNR